MEAEVVDSSIEDYFPINQKLSIKRTYYEDPENYPSYVKDFNHDYIFIEKPTKGGFSVSMERNAEIEVSVITNECVWSGPSTVIQVVSDSLGGVWITYPDYLEKVQRREFIRLAYDVRIKVCYMGGESVLRELLLPSANISAGGVAVRSKDKIARDKEIKVFFTINDIEIETRAKFIHAQYDIFEKEYVTGLEFLDVNTLTANKIHKAITQIQIEMRRKGLI